MRVRLSLVCALVLIAAPAMAQVVTFTDLGTTLGNSNQANAVNSAGVIVGTSNIPTRHAVVWENGVPAALDLGCPGCISVANDISEDGVIVGTVNGTAFAWSDGVTTLLQPLPGDTSSNATAINEAGVIVGSSGGRPVRWVNGVPEQLLTTADFSLVITDINNSGVIVGYTFTDSGTQGVVWQNGSVTLLPKLPGSCGGFGAMANAINDAGVIVGSSTDATCQPVAVRWINFTVQTLPLFAPGALGFARDINTAGDIVGDGRAQDQFTALLWRHTGEVVALGTLAGNSTLLTDISDAGHMVGLAQHVPGNPFAGFHAVLVKTNTPPTVAVPATIIAEAINASGTTVAYSVTAADNEDDSLSPSCAPASGSTFGPGLTTVSCSVTDSGGLSASASFVVHVQINDLVAQLAAQAATIATLQASLADANAMIATLQNSLGQCQAGSAAVGGSIDSIETGLAATFGTSFTMPGTTPQEQLSTLAQAIGAMNKGSKQQLYKQLGGK